MKEVPLGVPSNRQNQLSVVGFLGARKDTPRCGGGCSAEWGPGDTWGAHKGPHLLLQAGKEASSLGGAPAAPPPGGRH